MENSRKNSNETPFGAKISNGYQNVSPQEETELDSDTLCGLGPCKPKVLQPFSNMLSFSLYYGCSSLVTSALSMYLTSQITTLEKQFGLSSSETGLLQSMNDIGFLTFVLFVSYFSRHAHKPRVLGVCVIIFGFSAIVSAVPHFISSEPVMNISKETNLSMMADGFVIDHFGGESVCRIGHELNSPNATKPMCSRSETKSHNDAKFIALGIISAGMFFQGLAKSPRMALTQTYIDDNVIKTKTGIFIGIIACLSIFGPATAFAVGAQISRIYVTLEETELTVRDPRWIGAWWLGFIAFGIAALVLAGPMFLFPRRMVIKSKNAEKERAARELQRLQRDERGFLDRFKDMPAAIFKLLTNFTYMSILVAGTIDFFSMAGGVAFAAKYFEVYFGLSIFKANMLMGTTTIVAASTGMLAGGILTTKLKLRLVGCIKVMIISRIVSGLITFIPLFLDCPPKQITGLTEYGSSETFGRSSLDVSYSCSGCSCADSPYFPVCGSDGRNYYSPCVAGCSSKRGYQYTNCTCVLSGAEVGLNVTEEFTAVPGLCPAECNLVYVYVVSQVIGAFVATVSAMPQTVAAIRSVSEQEKTLSIGMSSFVFSLFGWTLGPVVFGYVIDGTCILWHDSCSQRGSCAIYDVYLLRNTLNGIGLVGRFICLVIFGVCLIRLTCFSKTEDGTKEDVEYTRDTEEKDKMLNDLEPIRVSSL